MVNPAETNDDSFTTANATGLATEFLRKPAPKYCGWCGRRLPDNGRIGRPRRYCAQPCRQRAYERRAAVQRGGLPEDTVVLSAIELSDLQDRLFQLRCAAEDIATAIDEDTEQLTLKQLAADLIRSIHETERLR